MTSSVQQQLQAGQFAAVQGDMRAAANMFAAAVERQQKANNFFSTAAACRVDC